MAESGTRAARIRFRASIEERRAVLAPGAGNALTARVIDSLGFETIYVSGAGIANTALGVPDIGLLTATELATTTALIAEVTDLPLVVDMDTGFGNAINVGRTVRSLEKAGAAAVQLEDQVFPKRCGHFSGKDVVPLDEMLSKIRAAVDARDDANLVVIARTDARAVEGLDRALDRARAFREAGADMTFVEAPVDAGEMERIGALEFPQVVNVVIGGLTPALRQAELRGMGFSLVLYANAALQASLMAMQNVLGHLKSEGDLLAVRHLMAGFAERQAIVRKDHFDAMEERYR